MTRYFIALAALTLVAMGTWFSTNTSASGVTMGIDADNSTNSANILGTIDTCRSVDVGADFAIDVWVKDVSALQSFEARVKFDGTKIVATSVDDQLFRAGFSGSGDETQPGNPANGSYYVSVGSAGATSDGSGVLARIGFHAEAAGIVPLTLHSPSLTSGPDAIQFTYSNAVIAVGQP